MKINLVRQNVYKYRRAEIIRRINFIVVAVSLSLFGLVIIFVTSSYIYYSIRGNQLRQSQQQLQNLYNSRAVEVVEYVRTKQVINNVSSIQSARFHYREFLAGIYDLLPSNAKLSTVDFSQEGVINVGIRMGSISDYEDFLSKVQQRSNQSDFLFKEVSQIVYRRDQNGSYYVELDVANK